MAEQYNWWQTGIIYQIYPRSFQDSNDDGIGDLPGLIQRLDYVQSLGVDAIWLSPIYPSPMADFGYDISDYCNIHPMFGTLDDFDRLLAEAHRRGLKIILDLVPNHTSNQHPWFIESRRSRQSYRRDWYIWRDPAPDGGPPNNWLSIFGGPAWTFDETTGQYYLHQFAKEQPELNYRHPGVLAAMLHNMRFWLNRGVDGFRVDVIWLLIKDELFRDEPRNPAWDGVTPHNSLLHIHTQNLPETHLMIRQMRAILDEYDNRVMIGEISLPNEQLVEYYGPKYDECHLPFNFQLITLPWQATVVRHAVNAYEAALPAQGWPNWVLGNHDQHRLASRVGQAQARVATLLLLTLRGTPTCYYGDEIGMTDGEIPLEFVRDPMAVNQPELAHMLGRDPERTPMQWTAEPNAGFTNPNVQPWLPLAKDYKCNNVAAQENNPTSILNLFRLLAALRSAELSLSVGDYAAVETDAADVFAYTRRAPNAHPFLVVLNFGPESHLLNLSHIAPHAKIAAATDMEARGVVDLATLALEPNQGLLLQIG
ncbi:MAG: Oligo-1,6-glucosidase [Anaerolineae bacterium]|nr:Oligo-1,6-glucosidase [Anaerolineae bacterium]